MSAKFTVSELAKMMGKPAKEVLFLLQGIGVDVKSVESVLDPGTAQAILTGKTQAPKTLIVRQTRTAPVPAAAAKAKAPERAALKRIKIVERAPDALEGEAGSSLEAGGTAVAVVTYAPEVETEVVETAAAPAVETAVEAPPAPRPAAAAEETGAGIAADAAATRAPRGAGIAADAAVPAPSAERAPQAAAPEMPQAEVVVPAQLPERSGDGRDTAAAMMAPRGAGNATDVAATSYTPEAVAGDAPAPGPLPESVTKPPAPATPPPAPASAAPAMTSSGSFARPAARVVKATVSPVSEGGEPPAAPGAHAAPSRSAAGAPPLRSPGGPQPTSVTATPPRRTGVPPMGAAGAHRATPASPPARHVPRPAGAPIRAAVPPAGKPQPTGALGRLLKRTGGELPLPRHLAPQPSSAGSSMEMGGGASAGPQSPGITTMRTPASAPPPPTPASAGASAQPSAPQRGAGGLGRAVIAPPTAATSRLVRQATQPVAPRPAATPVRPGATPVRPGMAPGRPGMAPGRPGMGPGSGLRSGVGVARVGPMMAPPPPASTDKRRKEAVKPGAKKEDAKKPASKKPRTKEVSALEEDVREYLGSFTPDTYDDVPVPIGELPEDVDAPSRPMSKSAQRKAGRKLVATDGGAVVEVKKNAPTGPVFLSEGVTVKELSEKTGILAKDLMKAFLQRGIFATINQPVDPKLAVEIAKDHGIDAAVVSFEEELELSRQQAMMDQMTAAHEKGDEKAAEAQAALSERTTRAPVVTVMGHVDHGKTSLLDGIRHANVAEGEAGGITQHIGAYAVEAKNRQIVFLDTPGHEAFTMMRARGARATDIVVLVVAADDGVMPQTVEAIDHARAAKVPIVVAINKIDKPEANTRRVKQELADKGVIVEDFGGEVVSCEISAKKRIGIDALLEMILLQADLLELKAVTSGPAKGVVLEARREVGKGTLATVLVQQGTLHVGDIFFAGNAVGRVRAMLDARGNRVNEVGPSTPAEVMGFDDLPAAGDVLQVVEDESKARQISQFRVQRERDESLAKTARMSLDSLFSRMKQGEAKELPLIVKADVHGSEEVLIQSLGKLSTEKVKVTVIHSGVGAISVNDVLLASASEAIVIGFNVKPEKKAQELAEKEGVDIRLYSVIYTLTDEIKKAMLGLLDAVKKETIKGHAEVRKTFKVPKVGTIAGCMVVDGLIPRNAQARLVRDNRVVFEGRIGSLRRHTDDASEVKTGFECGIGIAGYQDIKVGDVIEAFVTEEVAQTLS